MKRRTLLTGAGALMAGALAKPALVRAASATTLRFVPYADLALLDPIITTNYVTRTHALMIFDTSTASTPPTAPNRRWWRGTRSRPTASRGA